MMHRMGSFSSMFRCIVVVLISDMSQTTEKKDILILKAAFKIATFKIFLENKCQALFCLKL